MIKFSEYSKNLFAKLVAEGFEPIRGLGGNVISSETQIIGLVNLTGSMWRSVIIINANMMSSAAYENGVKQKMDAYFEGLLKEYGKKNIVVLNIFVSESPSDYIDFLSQDNFEFDRPIMNAYWEAGLYDGSLSVGKNSPDKIGNLKNIVLDSLNASHELNANFEMDVIYEEALSERPKLTEKGGPAPTLTYILIIINMLISATVFIGGDNAFMIAMGFGALFPQFVEQGEHYRLFSYMFLHADFMHLLNNCFSLYIFGSRAERFYGWPKMMIIYFAAGIFAGIVSTLLVPNPTIGASGAVFGLLGAILALAFKSKADIVGLNYPTIVVLTGISLALGFIRPEVNNHAHVGGLVAGFVLGLILIKTGALGKKADSFEN